MSSDAQLAKLEDLGELSRDFGLDITVSDGGLMTSALNQRQYRAECGKLYQEFMLSRADYIFEETQLKKRLQSLLLQKKQPHLGASDDNDNNNSTTDAHEEASLKTPEGHGGRDEDAFSPAQIEEFRRMANSRASNRSVSKAGVYVSPGDLLRPPTAASVRGPSRLGLAARAETPHIFPAPRERPLTGSPTSKTDPRVGSAATSIEGTTNRRQSATSSAMVYRGRDQDYDGVMDPTADFSASRRMRMNPRAFSRLTSAGRIKVKVMDKQGEFVMKPMVGQPGVVSVSGGGGGGGVGAGGGGTDKEGEGEKHQVIGSNDKMALVKTTTSFKTPTLSSELKRNNLVAIQKSLRGKEAKRMTVSEVMAKSRDRRARLFRVQMFTGRLDDWDVPGEERLKRPPTRAASAGTQSLSHHDKRGRGSSRLGMTPNNATTTTNTTNSRSSNSRGRGRVVDIDGQLKRSETPSEVTPPEEYTIGNPPPPPPQPQPPLSRAKTAPPNRSHVRSSSIPTPRRGLAGGGRCGGGGGGQGGVDEAGDGSKAQRCLTVRSSSRPRARARGLAGEAPPNLSVVQLELLGEPSPRERGNPSRHAAAAAVSVPGTPGTQPPSTQRGASYAVKRHSSTSSTSTSCAVFPLSVQSLTSDKKTIRNNKGKESRSVTYGRRGRSSQWERNRHDLDGEAEADAAERDCRVPIRHIHTLRDSAAVVRYWKSVDRDREEKLNKWRSRMSFAATRRGNLGKVLARV